MDNVNNNIVFILLICNSAISAIGQFILLYFLLWKKKKGIIFILVVGLVATNCVNAISICLTGIFNFVPFDQHEENTTTPLCCILSKPHYLVSVISAKQSPMITCSIGVIQLQNACSMKWERRKLLLKCLANMHTKKHNTGPYAVIINLVIHRRNAYRMCTDCSTIEEQFQDSKMITTFINAEYDLMMSVFSL
ncbi:hypothetical protein T09_11003 [Trichinella sp. T9]|nr:hypothetical protein T09_11003 [Trichinella sp. T9]